MSTVPTVEHIGRPFMVKPATSPLGVNEALSKNMKYLTENDHTLIMSKAKPLTFGKGEPLIREGAPSPAFYMIRSGSVRVQRGMTHLATLNAGNLCGEMTLLEASPASASVIAEEVVVVDAVEVENMREIFLAFPHLASRFYRSIALALSSRLRDTSCRLTELEKKVKGATDPLGVRQ
jgi:CRP/FNR family cyclic AMP-dependent transcriptional regulator